MTRKDLYKKTLQTILGHCDLANYSEEYLDITDFLNVDNFDNAIEKLLYATSGCIHTILRSMKNHLTQEELDLDINVRYSKFIYSFTPEKHKRNFYNIYSSCSCVRKGLLYINEPDATYDDQLWGFLEEAFLNDQERELIITDIKNEKEPDEYYIAFNTSILGYGDDEDVPLEEVYAYSLANKIHQGENLEIPQELRFEPQRIDASFEYSKEIVYFQYMDIYDVYNEFLHSKDILSAFQTMYQMLEYIVYRKLLAALVKLPSIKQSFLRGISNLDNKYHNNERTTFIKGITDLLEENTLDNTDIEHAENFILKFFGSSKDDESKAYLNKDITNQNKKKHAIAEFIYDVRCSIVHNKESEFHITYNNYDEYSTIIPLLRSLLAKLPNRIFDILNQVDSDISYKGYKNIETY